MEDWTEKYRPQHLHEIIGNERALAMLQSWAEQWNRSSSPKKKAVILSGKAGTGKTSSAHALAHDFKWTIIELNASDTRNEATIKRIATAGAINETFDDSGHFTPSRSGGRKLIILDEADNLYEKVNAGESGSDFSDRGGKKAIIDMIQKTKHPIILIVNDYYALTKAGGEPFKNLCTLISFYEVGSFQIVDLLRRICIEEKIQVDIKVLRTLADRCKGDVRSAVNDLQSLCVNRRHLDMTDLDVLGYRDRETIIFDALREVFKTTNLQASRDCVNQVDIDPELFLLWITENLPREYLDSHDLVKGYEALAKADIFFGRANRWRHFDLWSYACDLMSQGVSTARSHSYGNDRYVFPTWLKDMRGFQSTRMTRDTLLKKVGTMNHTSKQKSRSDVFPSLQYLFQNDMRFACKLTQSLDLTEAEIKYLLGEKHCHHLKEILQCYEKASTQQEEIELPEIKGKEEKEEIEDDLKQPSIFDF